jgi:hypothetical protein
MRPIVAVLLAATLACDLTSPEGDAADVRGTWQLTGTQAAPDLDLEGSFSIEEQDGQVIAGSATWNETSPGGGGVTMVGGPISGRAIGQSDVDFDVTLSSGTRRFVARLVADTISGAWVQVSTSTNGTFRAVRGTP